MRYWLLVFLMVGTSTDICAQVGTQADQRQIDQLTIQRMQLDLTISRIQAETERLRRSNEKWQQEAEQERRTQELRDLIERRATAEAKAIEKAEEAADEIREELLMSSVRAADLAYLSFALVTVVGFGIYIAHRQRQDGAMKYEQKFGVVVMLSGLLLSLFSIAVSNDWHARLDAVQNIFLTLRLQFFRDSESLSNVPSYMVDVPTKYVLTFFTAVIAYGFTTYLGITPAWKKTVELPVHKAPHQR